MKYHLEETMYNNYYQSKINKRHYEDVFFDVRGFFLSSAKVMSKSGNNNFVRRTGLV